MTKHMLIDATHTEETRVVVMNNKHVDDYDVETSARRQLKGNIYLAKVIRVEPSLQAAFVDYGGNRHGFLAFSEIHPDYFQIPVADREKLLALQEEEYAAEHNTLDDDDFDSDQHADELHPEIVSGEHDTGEEQTASRRTALFLRNYQIQEVIRRRQILLVQVVKEERGNKGAALSTYVSLAGRYSVLMPNALRGGGVSRKITSDTDRKRLRDIISSLNLPHSMAMIIRTAGAGRPEPEIIRDCDYLLQLWDDIRAHALNSVAPTLVYEEASLIKRAIRDLFTRDIETVYVDGEPAWKNARDFTRLLMPSNANRIRLWQNRGQNLFSYYNVENHLDAMFSPTVQLESGGYLVINQTEALVAIDVNSGKATSQRNIENTALHTNLEAAEEVARQLRLRDLAGLIVIDFIDMESRRHNNQVEKRLKDSLRLDRARIQIGHISHFGLLEMSRQRLRPSLAESMLTPCPHCQGTGSIRGVESTALHVLRSIEEEASSQRASHLGVHVSPNIVLYMLNSKRLSLAAIEQRHKIKVVFEADEALMGTDIRIDRLQSRQAQHDTVTPAKPAETARTIDMTAGEASAPPAGNTFDKTVHHDDHTENGKNKRRRNRRRRPYHDAQSDFNTHDTNTQHDNEVTPEHNDQASTPPDNAELMPGRRRTRVRRSNSQQEKHTISSKPVEQPTRRRSPQSHDSVYRGPTPADPFQGFDIFDIMDQGGMEHFQESTSTHTQVSATPQHEATSSHEEEQPTPPRRTRRKRPSRNKKTEITTTNEATPSANISLGHQNEKTSSSHEAPASQTAAEPLEATPTPKQTRRPKRTRKPSTSPKEINEDAAHASSDEKEKEELNKTEKPVKKRRTTRHKKAEPSTSSPSVEEATAPQPINVDETKPTKRRVGWWKR